MRPLTTVMTENTHPRRLLLIENDPDIATAIRDLLTALRYTVDVKPRMVLDQGVGRYSAIIMDVSVGVRQSCLLLDYLNDRGVNVQTGWRPFRHRRCRQILVHPLLTARRGEAHESTT